MKLKLLTNISFFFFFLLTTSLFSKNNYKINLEYFENETRYKCITEIKTQNTSNVDLDNIYLYFYPFKVQKNRNIDLKIKITDLMIDSIKADYTIKNSYIIINTTFKKNSSKTIKLSIESEIPTQQINESNLENIVSNQLMFLINKDKNPKIDYGIFSKTDNIISLCYFYPSIIRMNDKGFILIKETDFGDLFTLDAFDCDLEISLAPNLTPVVNGLFLSSKQKETKTNYDYKLTNVRDIAIAAYKTFYDSTIEVDGIKVTAYNTISKDKNINILNLSENILKIYNKNFGKYPFNELKIVELPLLGGAGGIEFSGMIGVARFLYNVDIFKSNSEFSEIFNKILAETLEFAIAHEIAHQWWYSGLGFDSNESPFIDEGLASFSAALYFKEQYSNEKYKNIIFSQITSGYKLIRILEYPDAPLKTKLEDFKDAIHFAGIIYGKSPAFLINMYEKDSNLFLKNLKNIYENNRFTILTETFFLDNLKKDFPGNINTYYNRWLSETNADTDIGIEDFITFYKKMGFDLTDQAKISSFLLELLKIPAFQSAINELEKEIYQKY